MIWVLQVVVVIVAFAVALQLIRQAPPVLGATTKWLLTVLVACVFIAILCGLVGLTGPGCYAPAPFNLHR